MNRDAAMMPGWKIAGKELCAFEVAVEFHWSSDGKKITLKRDLITFLHSFRRLAAITSLATNIKTAKNFVFAPFWAPADNLTKSKLLHED